MFEIAELPKKKRMLRVVTVQGLHFDLNTPDDFNMIGFVQSVRAAGYILNENMYQPLAGVATFFLWSEDKPPKPGEGIVIPFPEKPAS